MSGNSAPPLISIAIPNFNYAAYLPTTVSSVLTQQGVPFEIVIADNASTDQSVELVRAMDDPRVRIVENRCNVGFASNIDRAVGPTTGAYTIVLSSDDVMNPGALAQYARLVQHLDVSSGPIIVSSSVAVIDGEGKRTGRLGPHGSIWRDSDRDSALSDLMGVPVLSIDSSELLRRSILSMKNPLNFASTLFPRSVYDQLEGFGGSRLYNPDKWFYWRAFETTARVVFVDDELFSYRVHGANQAVIQRATGALKFHVDEYRTTFEVTDSMLAHAKLTRSDLVAAFLRRDIVERGFAAVAEGRRAHARRLVHLARASYPREARREVAVAALHAASFGGPLASVIARRFEPRFRKRAGVIDRSLWA